MSTEQNFSGFYQETKNLLKEYLEVKFTLMKLKGIKSVSRLLSLLIVIFLVSILALFVMLFLGFSFAWWLSAKTGSNIMGFAGTAALFTIIMLLCILLRKPLFQGPLIRLFIEESTKEHDESL